MTKEISDLTWSVLPKEFKEEVKYEYSRVATKAIKSSYDLGFMNAHEGMYGIHNLTSDAEGDEMLTYEKSKVKDLLQWCNESSEENEEASIVKNILSVLFGSKCLPDEAQPKQKDCDNPLADKEGCRWRNDGKCAFDSACYFEPLNPQEPKSFKYKVGQKVILHFYGGEVSTITEAFNDGGVWNKYKVKALPHHIWNENELDPYEEPKEVTKMKPIESKVSVYLATKEEDEEFRQLLHNNGFKWNASIPLINFAGWSSSFEDSKIHCIYPDKIVACYGKKHRIPLHDQSSKSNTSNAMTISCKTTKWLTVLSETASQKSGG